MARTETFIDAPPEQVFELLSDPRTYGEWVVGSREIRAADDDWPAAGAQFAHSVGLGPLAIKDRTSVLAAEPPHRLELLACARPFPPARVTLQLHPEGSGTRLVMTETPANLLLALMLGPLGHRLLGLRNVESLRRLRHLAEGVRPRPQGRLPALAPDG